jgi:hypothetical protein
MLNIDLVKADALRRLRPFLKQTPAGFQRDAKAKRDEARAYLAEVARAHLTALLDGQVLPPIEELEGWFDGVLKDAVANTGIPCSTSCAPAIWPRLTGGSVGGKRRGWAVLA